MSSTIMTWRPLIFSVMVSCSFITLVVDTTQYDFWTARDTVHYYYDKKRGKDFGGDWHSKAAYPFAYFNIESSLRFLEPQ